MTDVGLHLRFLTFLRFYFLDVFCYKNIQTQTISTDTCIVLYVCFDDFCFFSARCCTERSITMTRIVIVAILRK